jgi:hypothetical protein
MKCERRAVHPNEGIPEDVEEGLSSLQNIGVPSVHFFSKPSDICLDFFAAW